MKLFNKIIIVVSLFFLIVILWNIKSFAVTGTVTEITVNVREKATTKSKKIMYVTQDDKVEVLEKEGEWYKIQYKKKTGYILGKYIKVNDKELTSKNKSESKVEEPVEELKEEPSTNIAQKWKIEKGTAIRIVPNITSSIIYTASKDTGIDVLEQIEGWTYISTNDLLGWVRSDKIIEKDATNTADTNEKDTKQNETTQKVAYIKYDMVNLRQKASTNSKSLAKLKMNEEVTILETVNSVWVKVKYNKQTGYISADLISDKKQKGNTNDTIDNTTTSRDGETITREENADKKNNDNNTSEEQSTSPQELESTTSKTKGEEIVNYAKKYLNYKYVSGGASPRIGFDCSGFTYYVYKHFGYTLPTSSVKQAKVGTKVEKADLQPGDLLIYKNTDLTKIGHVGIYIGNNQMIHASEPGVGVIITDIDSKSYNYPKRYVMARRIVK